MSISEIEGLLVEANQAVRDVVDAISLWKNGGIVGIELTDTQKASLKDIALAAQQRARIAILALQPKIIQL